MKIMIAMCQVMDKLVTWEYEPEKSRSLITSYDLDIPSGTKAVADIKEYTTEPLSASIAHIYNMECVQFAKAGTTNVSEFVEHYW